MSQIPWPLVILLVGSVLGTGMRRAHLALAGRRERRVKAEAAEYARITGWITKIRPHDAGPAITRGENGEIDLFRGLRRYSRSRRRMRRGRRA